MIGCYWDGKILLRFLEWRYEKILGNLGSVWEKGFYGKMNVGFTWRNDRASRAVAKIFFCMMDEV